MSGLSSDLIRGAIAAAQYIGCGVNARAVYRMTESGHLPVIRKGRILFYRKSDLDRAFPSAPVTEAEAAASAFAPTTREDVNAELLAILQTLVDCYGSFNGKPFDLPADHPICAARKAIALATTAAEGVA